MQIIVPMSGFGERFRRAGYAVPKPLIEVESKPIIGHVIEMFPGEADFVFVCNQDHLNNPFYRMEEIIRSFCLTGKIVGIPPHKLGPVHAVMQAANYIKLDEPIVVNYCDFTCYWDWNHFKKFVETSNCAGSIPAYKGFHPHTLGSTNYAYMRENNGWVSDIQEKQPYTKNRMEEFASSGTYYFSSGKLMLDAFQETIGQNLNVGGEHYVSLAYKPLLQKAQPISVYPLQHFMQWGTPDDVAEYNYWSKAFRTLSNGSSSHATSYGASVIPMAGLGKRFQDEGFVEPKPLIQVSGKPMAVQAVDDLPRTPANIFILRTDLPEREKIEASLKYSFPGCKTIDAPGLTEGQACTALLGVNEIQKENTYKPVTFGPCDSGALYDVQKFQALLEDDSVDVIVWAARSYPNAVRRPEMYGWLDCGKDSNRIKSVSVKTPLLNPANDPVVIGTFTFKNPENFKRSVEALITRNGRVNGEFYIDSCINDAIALGLKCVAFEIDSYLSWGTPSELRTFQYWQSCFHKWHSHPYRLEKDSDVAKQALTSLEKLYAKIEPSLLAPKSC